MKTFLTSVMVVLSVLVFVGVGNATLTNAGDQGEWFFDSLTGLYWYDPGAFSGASRDKVDSFVETSSVWQYATRSQILALFEAYKAVEQSSTLYDIIGKPTGAVGIEGYGGVLDAFEGFYAESGPGSLALYVEPRDNPTIFFPWMIPAERTLATSTSGAWLVADRGSSGSGVPEPSTLFLVAAGLVGLAGFKRARGTNWKNGILEYWNDGILGECDRNSGILWKAR